MSPCTRFLLFLILAFSSQATAQQTGNISQEKILSWTVAGMTPEHELALLKARGLQNNSATLISAMTSAGAKDAVLAYLRTSTAPQKEESAPSFAALVKSSKAIERKDYERAFNHIHELFEADPKNADLHFAAAGILRRAGSWEEAAKEYRIVTQLAPRFLEGWQGLALSHYREGDAPGAASFAREAIKLDPNDSDSYKFLGLALSQLEDNAGALKAYGESLRLNPKNASTYYDRAILEFDQGKVDEAIADGRKATELNPFEWTHWYNLGLSFDKKDDFDNAIKAYKRAKGVNPEALEVRQNLGHDYCASQQHAAAIAEFRELLKIDPTWNMARPCLANSLALTNDLKGAVDVGVQFLRYEPQDERMLQAMVGWYWALDRLTESEPLYDRLLAIQEQKHGSSSREYGYVLTQRAMLYGRQKKYLQADADYRNGLKMMRASGPEYGPIADAVQRSYDEMLSVWHGAKASTAVSGPTGASPNASAIVSSGSPLIDWESRLQVANDAMNQGHFGEAVAFFDEAVLAAKKIIPENGQLAQTLQQYAGLYMKQGKFSDAERLFQESVEAAHKSFSGPKHEASALDALGTAYLMQKKYHEAAETYAKEMQVAAAYYGQRSPMTGMAMDHLASAYVGENHFDEAEQLLVKYVAQLESFYGKEDYNVAVPLDHLGALYRTEKKYPQAEVVYRRALAISEKRFGVNSPMLSGTLYILADTLRQLARPDEAKAFEERREALAKK